MSIEPSLLITTLIGGLVVLLIGVLMGWLAARPAQARLTADLERERAVHAERLRTYQDA